MKMPTVFDKLLILSLHEEKCTVLPSVSKKLEIGVSGGILVELTLRGEVQAKGSSNRLELAQASETGDDLLDETVALIQGTEQNHKFGYWIKHLRSQFGADRERLIARLVANGVLNQSDDGLTWVTPYADSPNQHASAKYVLKSQLRELVLTQGEADLSDLALLGLVKASNLLNLVFTKDERKAAKRWIYTALTSRALKEESAQTLQAIEMAIDSQAGNS
jgi:hypothetical protein